MSVLVILLVASVITGVGLGLLAGMPPRQIAGQSLALCAVAVGFWALVALL